MTYGALLLLFAFQVAQVNDQPSPSAAPPKEIIRVRSTPFCQVFRQNIFRAVEGLLINDAVIDHGRSVLAKWAYDGVVDQKRNSRIGGGSVGGGSIDMDSYQLGQVAFQAGRNLVRVYNLLNDPTLFPKDPQSDADRDLAVMKARIEAVADAQERSLDIINGTYETAALNDLLGRGDNSNGAMGPASIDDKTIELGDPTSAPGSGSGVGQMYTAIDISQRLTGRVEDRVDDAVLPGINRCRNQ